MPLQIEPQFRENDTLGIRCERCGGFVISGSYAQVLLNSPLTPRQMANASGWVRANQVVTLTTADRPHLHKLPTPSVADKGEKIVRHVLSLGLGAGERFTLDTNRPELQAIAWARDADELLFVVRDYLTTDRGYLEPDSTLGYRPHTLLTPAGWAYVDSLNRGSPDSPFGFVAMWFTEDTKALREEGIKPAIRDAGYDARLIDEVHHGNHIDDEIIAAIRKSMFLVADLTGQRPNVYYEAGFAQGLDTKVVWTCQKDEIDDRKLHLDVRQYAFVPWTLESLPEFRKRLTARIIGYVGRGPIR